MAINFYNNAASGNPTNVWQSPELLASADAAAVTDKFVKSIRVPKNKNETVSMLRLVTPDVDINETPEGVTKTSRAQTYEQVTKTLEEFDEYFTISSRQAELGERDVLADSKDRLKDLIVRTREQNAWADFRTPNNILFNSNGITALGNVNGVAGLGRFQLAGRLIEGNRGQKIKEMSVGSVNDNTTPMEPAFVVWCHPHCKYDIRQLPGFRPAAQVGGVKDKMPEWFGTVDEFMFVTSQEFSPQLAAGAAVGATGMLSAGGSNIDVYTYLVFGKEALGRVGLGGSESKGGAGGLEFYVHKNADKSDPTNKRRIVGARWWDGPVVCNPNWVVAIKSGVTAVPV